MEEGAEKIIIEDIKPNKGSYVDKQRREKSRFLE